MVRVKKHAAAALALGLAMSALATPSFAQRSEDGMNAGRATAIRECSTQAGKFKQYTWGDTEITTYRSCMAQHGQQE